MMGAYSKGSKAARILRGQGYESLNDAPISDIAQELGVNPETEGGTYRIFLEGLNNNFYYCYGCHSVMPEGHDCRK
jgi:hypothetical protein